MIIWIVLLAILCIILYNKVSRIEHFIKNKYGEGAFEDKATPVPMQTKPVPAAVMSTPIKSQKIVAKPVAGVNDGQANPLKQDLDVDRLFRWFSTDWPMKLGAFFVILGFGWLVGYAFINDWIGPVGRIALGFVAGALFLLWGEVHMHKSKHQGVVLLILGASVVLVTVYAAREVYDFFTPFYALLIMSLVTLFMAISSIKNRLLSLAHLSILVGATVPLLTVQTDPSMVGLFSYALVLVAGAMIVVMFTGWRSLMATAMTVAVLYQLPFIANSAGSVTESLAYASLFGLLFFLGNIAGMIHGRNATKADIYVAAVNGAVLLAWISMTAPEAFRGLMAASVGLVFTVGAYIVHKATGLKNPVAIYGGLALVLLGASTAFELSGSALTIAYILEVSAVLAGVAHVSRSHTSIRAISALFVLPLFLSSGSLFANSWRDGIFHSDNFVLLLIVVVFWVLAIYMQKLQARAEDTTVSYYAGAYATVAAVYGVIVLWLNTHALFSDDIASLIALAIYTVVGLYFYLNSAFLERRGYQLAGKLLLIVVVVRLLLIDVWVMDIVGRIITFFLIGALFMSSAFIKKHSQHDQITNK